MRIRLSESWETDVLPHWPKVKPPADCGSIHWAPKNQPQPPRLIISGLTPVVGAAKVKSRGSALANA
jgi:hypothetical protein